MTEANKTVENSGQKYLAILWVSGLVLFLAVSAVLTGLWMSTRNERKAANLAGANVEFGQVLGASTQDPDYLVNLVSSLKFAGFVLYGYDGDDSTKKQLQAFGQAVSNLDYVECNSQAVHANADECLAKGIVEYPTWVKIDQKFAGFKSLSELEKLLAAYPSQVSGH